MPPAHPPSLIPVCTLQIVSFNIASLAQIATHQKACQVLMLCVARNPKRREIPWLIEILDFPEHLAKTSFLPYAPLNRVDTVFTDQGLDPVTRKPFTFILMPERTLRSYRVCNRAALTLIGNEQKNQVSSKKPGF